MKKNKKGNFTVRCIKEHLPGHYATLNKIYEVEDGVITFDSGGSNVKYIKNIEQLNNDFISKFELAKKPKKSELKEQVVTLKEQIEHLTNENNQLKKNTKEDCNDIQELKDYITDLATRKTRIELELEKYLLRSKELQVAVDRRNKRIEHLNGALETLKEQVKCLTTNNKDNENIKKEKQLKAIKYIKGKKIAINIETQGEECEFIGLVCQVFGDNYSVNTLALENYCEKEFCVDILEGKIKHSNKAYYGCRSWKIVKFKDLEELAEFAETIKD